MPSWVLRRRRLVAVVVVVALCAQCTTQASASETDDADSTSVSSSLSGGTAGTPVMRPLAMSLLAGLATGVGGIISVYLGAHPSPSHMGAVLSFAAGVMATVSVFDLWLPVVLVEAGRSAVPAARFRAIIWYTTMLAFGGGAFFALSRALPDNMDPPQLLVAHMAPATLAARKHRGGADDVEVAVKPSLPRRASFSRSRSFVRRRDSDAGNEDDIEVGSHPRVRPPTNSGNQAGKPNAALSIRAKWRLAAIMMVTLTLHNFPEGMAVAVSSMKSHELGGLMAFAIAMHNIPEGIAIATPVLSATGSWRIALGMALLSGLSEPLGAGVAVLVLQGQSDESVASALDSALCFVAGVMLSVCVFELIPQAFAYVQLRIRVWGWFLAGSVVLLLTLLGA